MTWINIGTRDAEPFSLFRLDAGGLKHRYPDLLLQLEPVGQLLRRAAHRDQAALCEIFLLLRRRHGRVQRLIQPGDGRRWRAGGSQQRVDDRAVDIARPSSLKVGMLGATEECSREAIA